MREVPVLVLRENEIPRREVAHAKRLDRFRSIQHDGEKLLSLLALPRLLIIGFALLAGHPHSAVASSLQNTNQQGSVTGGRADAASSLLAQPPRTWAVDAAANELIALHHTGSYLRYRMHVRDDKGDQVRDVIESKDGTVARLVQRDGRALTSDEDKAERGRLDAMVAAPNDYYKHVKNEESGRKIADSIIRLMPDAMIYTYVPDQPQSGTNRGAIEVVMDYEPDPKWKPPTTTSAALTGLKGRMWVDASTRQLVRMEGNIFQSVNFGWGMLAHIYPGGRLVLEQTNAGGQRWIYTHFTQQITVKALMVKTINVRANVDADSFQTLPAMTYQEAVKMLLDTPLPTK